jgi:superfamily II DNA or RNA helicase
MRIVVDPSNIDDYRKFLAVKSLPSFRCAGRELSFPDEYASLVNGEAKKPAAARKYKPWPGLFDYQRDIAAMAIQKRKFAIFADCGLGKTMMLLEFMRHAAKVLPTHKRLLIVCPLMVVRQTLAEAAKFYEGELDIEHVPAAELADWLKGEGNRLGITNYDALTDDLKQGCLGCLVLDESSVLKSHYGKWGQVCLNLGAGLDWKLCLTGTPAPNDRIEYANHAVFLDAFPTINAFLARYFVNRGQTQERWVLKPHAIGPFYRALSHWSIFLANPETYGWKDNAGKIPPIITHIHHVDMTQGQRDAVLSATGELFVTSAGGITKRSKLAQIGKGTKGIASDKPVFIRSLVESWPTESTIIWCLYNEEQDGIAKMFPDAANIDGSTPIGERERLIADFKAGTRRILISKPKILGFGLNLQIATRQIFSGLQDSYESYYQAVKRSNRVGSTRPLNVHIPVTEVEVPMIESVLRKADRVQADTDEQEKLFKAWKR